MRVRFFTLFILLYAASLFQCSTSEQQSKNLLVAASIPPLADFAEKIGGSYVRVFTIVPPGTNPHTFELTPGLMKKLSRADLLVFNGVGLEFWLDKVEDNLAGKKIVYAAKGLQILADDLERHAQGNPHVWLDPQNAIYMVKRIYGAFVDVDPAHKAYYEHNAAVLIKEIEVLDQDIMATVDSWSHKKFVCFHPAWAYFARRYGLEQAGVIEKRPGMQPSPGDIADIIKTVKNIGARVIFAEAQFPSQMAEVIAKDSGVKVIPLDPLGSQGQKSYIELMRYNVAQMSKGMK